MIKTRTPLLRAGASVLVAAIGLAVTATTTGVAISSAATPASPASLFRTKLSGVCPNPLIVQTNWLPEADHGALYELIGSGGTYTQYSYEGPLGSTGIKLQILSGGPGDAYLPTAATMYSNNPVVRVTPQMTMDSTETDIQVSKKFPTIAVMNLQDHDPQVLIYNPARFSSLTTIPQFINAAKQGAMFYVSGVTYAYVQFLIHKGIPQSAFIGGYSGDLDKFVTGNGMIINQGYADSEPFLLAHDTPAWGHKSVKETFVYTLGLNDYPSAIEVRAGDLKAMAPCLTRLVPMLQNAVVDYFAHPEVVNSVLARFNPTYSASYWSTPVAESNWADTVQRAKDIVGNSDNGTGPVGGFDMTRLAGVVKTLLPIFAQESPGTFNPTLTAGEVATNKFVDPSIRFP